MLFLEIKEELTKKNIEIEKEELEEISKTTKLETIINYIREMIYILINTKFPKKNDEANLYENININKDSEIVQLQSQIRKLEYDIRYLIQKEFQNKIKRDSLEMKINAYMEMESEFEDLKEKVKYEGGKFLNNEKKDNEIIILRQENCILKKEIDKYEINNKKYESKLKSEKEKIDDLNNQVTSLNKKVSELELINSKKESGNQQNNNNSSINININNNGNTSSKWIIKQENQEISNNTNNSNSLIPNMNPGSSFALKKRRINNFTKNYRKFNSNLGQTTTNNYNLQLRSKLNLYEKRINNGSQNKMHKSHSRAANHQENNNAFTATYNKILNNLFIKNKTPNKRDKNYKKKKISSTINIDDYDRTIINNINKSRKFKSNAKNNSYNKIIGIIPNSRFPLSSKHQGNKNMSSSIPKKNLVREKSNVSHSSLIINKK